MESEIIDKIEELEEGDKVLFECGRRKKLNFNYEVDKAGRRVAMVVGPDGGEWMFRVADGEPKLLFDSPSSGVQTLGTLDRLEVKG